MRIGVLGLWHLGTVTAAGLAALGHEVTAYDDDESNLARLRAGVAPVFEPGLEDLIHRGLSSGKLRFAAALHELTNVQLLWATYDTPVDEDDNAESDLVIDRMERALEHVRPPAILVSCQLPVGSIRRLERAARDLGLTNLAVAYSPENLRLGNAVGDFGSPDRIVLGVRPGRSNEVFYELLTSITHSIESHVRRIRRNGQARRQRLSSGFDRIHQRSRVDLCLRGSRRQGGGARLKTERRIGARAYVAPGRAFSGGTLARDVSFLTTTAAGHRVAAPLLSAVLPSNRAHGLWAQNTLRALFGDLSRSTVCVWGLTYKPGTDTLRRSLSVEFCEWLIREGANVRVHDPAVKCLPPHWHGVVERDDDPVAAIRGAHALVIGTEWPMYRAVSAGQLTRSTERLAILDANRFLPELAAASDRLRYLAVGTPLRGILGMSRVLENRCAIVTGASQGLGLTIARKFLDAGASLLICARDAGLLDRSAQELAQAAGPGQSVIAMPADVSRPAAVTELVDRALHEFGRLDILVNNAGVVGPIGAVDEVDWEEWVRALQINLLGSVLLCRALLPHFKQLGRGKNHSALRRRRGRSHCPC